MRSILFLLTFICICTPVHAMEESMAALDAVAIWREPDRLNYCAITFDDGPTPYTPALLDALKEEGVKATFFVLGQQVGRYPDVVRRIVSEGHEVASHGYSHPNMRKLTATVRESQIDDTNALLYDLGIAPRYFRPPYGNYDDTLVEMVEARGMRVILWTTDSRDWKMRALDYHNMPNCFGRPLDAAEMRGVFLFHDTRKRTAEDVHQMVQALRQDGCQSFVTVHEYFTRRNQPQLLTPDHPGSRLVAQRNAVTSDQGGGLGAQHKTALEQSKGPTYNFALPAGSTPIPLARSSRLWLKPMLFRGE